MTAKLIDGSLDVAIALTEGLLAGIAKGHDAYKIVGTYVESPLCKLFIILLAGIFFVLHSSMQGKMKISCVPAPA